MQGFPDECRDAVAGWAVGCREVTRVWLFGSRAKGDFRSDSDADIALELDNTDAGEALGDWICLAPRWKAEIALLLPMPLHLHAAFDDDEVVMPAVRHHGILLFERHDEKRGEQRGFVGD